MLDPEVAAQFLTARTGDADQGAALELAQELGGLPLALEQAAAYMQATGTPGPVPAAVPSAAGRPASAGRGGRAPGACGGDAGPGPVPAGSDAPAAAGLVRLLAFLAPEPVPLGLLLAGPDAAEELCAERPGRWGRCWGDCWHRGRGGGAAPVLARRRARRRAGPGAPAGASRHPRPYACRPAASGSRLPRP